MTSSLSDVSLTELTGTLRQGMRIALFIGIGVVAGAQLGAYFSNRIKPKGIVKALAVALIIVGIRLLFS